MNSIFAIKWYIGEQEKVIHKYNKFPAYNKITYIGKKVESIKSTFFIIINHP